MVWNVKGWRGPSRAIWFGGFARVRLSYTNLGTVRDDSRSVLSINLAWLTWLPVLIDLHRIDPSAPWSLNPALESRQLINFHRNLYPIGLDLEERWSRCFINIFLAQHLANLNLKSMPNSWRGKCHWEKQLRAEEILQGYLLFMSQLKNLEK